MPYSVNTSVKEVKIPLGEFIDLLQTTLYFLVDFDTSLGDYSSEISKLKEEIKDLKQLL